MPYECRNYSTPTPFAVYPGDILVACVPDAGSPPGRLGIVAAVAGAVVRQNNGFGGCTSLPASPIDLSTYSVINDLTLHVRLSKY